MTANATPIQKASGAVTYFVVTEGTLKTRSFYGKTASVGLSGAAKFIVRSVSLQ